MTTNTRFDFKFLEKFKEEIYQEASFYSFLTEELDAVVLNDDS